MAGKLGDAPGDATAKVVAKVVWTLQATLDLQNIRDWVAQERPVTAHASGERLKLAAAALDRYPNRGRLISHDRRELAHVRPYLFHYRVVGEGVETLEVRHSARRAD